MLTKIRTLIDALTALPIYIGNMPATPNDVVAVFASGGAPRDLAGSMIREPSFQVRVRSTSYATGYAAAEAIATGLHGVNGTSDFLLIAQMGDIQDIGRDDQHRQEWTINFRCYYVGES